MTRTGNRLTTADVSEWDGDDEMEHAIYNYNHNANGAMTFDSMSGISGTVFSWNAAGLLHAFVDDDSSERVEIIWLSDGTKVKTDGDVDSPRYYRGSFVYKDVCISIPTGAGEGDYDTYEFEALESIAHSEGRFVATDWTTTGVPTLSDRHFVRDLVGSTVAVIDVVSAAASIDLSSLGDALIEQDAYLAYGDRLSASAMTLKTDTGNRYRFNGKERHDWAGYPYIDYGARMYNPLIGSWLSPDPLADKYTSTSPYVFCAGDPVNYVDPDGTELYIYGKRNKEAFEQLQSAVSKKMTLSMDSRGKISYKPTTEKKLHGKAKRLAKIIDDSSIEVKVSAENTQQTKDGKQLLGGAFMGNKVENKNGIQHVVAYQEVNPIFLGKVDEAYGTKGTLMMHEVTEAYEGALISKKEGSNAPPADDSQINKEDSVYNRAHNAATQQPPIYYRQTDVSGKIPSDPKLATRTQYYIIKGGKIIEIEKRENPLNQ